MDVYHLSIVFICAVMSACSCVMSLVGYTSSGHWPSWLSSWLTVFGFSVAVLRPVPVVDFE
jgi:hypothetical protein